MDAAAGRVKGDREMASKINASNVVNDLHKPCTSSTPSGVGTLLIKGKPGGAGYKAQNNTQTICTDPDTVNRYRTRGRSGTVAPRRRAIGGAHARVARWPHSSCARHWSDRTVGDLSQV